jgi:biopolymer transport protein ExbD
MKKGKYLLRFVDVVLILLFGFIVISDIDEDSQIVLPSSYEAEITKPSNEIVLFIGVTTNGDYIDEREKILLNSESALRDYIRSHKNRFGDVAKVRIRANYDTQSLYAMRVAQICDELDIKKSLDVRIVK